jgi:hypothetical protein
MRQSLLLVVGILLAFGIIFARNRLKRAFQIGAILYGVVLLVRLVIFGVGDADNLLDLIVVGSVFFLVWLVAWAATRFILDSRGRSEEPPS